MVIITIFQFPNQSTKGGTFFLTHNNIIEIEKKSLSIIREYFTHYPISSFELSSKFHLLSADYPIFQRLPIIRFLSENSAYYPFG